METLDRLALPSDNRKGPNCGVTALSIFAGISFDDAWTRLARLVDMRSIGKPRGQWKGQTYLSELFFVIGSLGISTRHTKTSRRISLETFVARNTLKDVVYLVRTTGHLQVVLNGFVTDQMGTRAISDYRGKRKFVTDWIERSERFEQARTV